MTLCMVIAGGLGAACSKPSTSTSTATSGSASPLSVGSGSASATNTPAAPVKGSAPATGQSEGFAGSYVAKLGPVDPPADSKEKAWTQDPGTEATGKGTIELTVEGVGPSPTAPRKVTGDAKGPLGPLGISGTFDGHELRANLAPKDGKVPNAMTGFMTLTAEGSASLKGVLRVANGNARIVREASVELARR
jgi:hypothetical protein